MAESTHRYMNALLNNSYNLARDVYCMNANCNSSDRNEYISRNNITYVKQILLEPIIEVDGRVDELHARLDNDMMECQRADHEIRENTQKSMLMIDERVDGLEFKIAEDRRLFAIEKEQRKRGEQMVRELVTLTAIEKEQRARAERDLCNLTARLDKLIKQNQVERARVQVLQSTIELMAVERAALARSRARTRRAEQFLVIVCMVIALLICV